MPNDGDIRPSEGAGFRPVPPQTNYRRVSADELPDGHPVGRFHDYYLANRDRDGWLQRSAFDPLDIFTIMPWLQILEETEPDLYRYRLCGTQVCRLLNADLTGRLMRDIVDDRVHAVRLAEIDDAWAAGEPVFSASELNFPRREFITVIRGLFPGQHDGRRILFFPVAPGVPVPPA